MKILISEEVSNSMAIAAAFGLHHQVTLFQRDKSLIDAFDEQNPDIAIVMDKENDVALDIAHL